MIINDSVRLNEARATFMDKLKSSKVGDSFNIFSGSRNFVVTQVASDKFKVVPGKGYDKGMTAYINKCYLNPKEDQIVTRNALQNFIRTINSNNGWREDLDLDSTEDELTESDTDKRFIVKYVDRNDRSAEDIVVAKNKADAKKKVKPHAYRILSVEEYK